MQQRDAKNTPRMRAFFFYHRLTLHKATTNAPMKSRYFSPSKINERERSSFCRQLPVRQTLYAYSFTLLIEAPFGKGSCRLKATEELYY